MPIFKKSKVSDDASSLIVVEEAEGAVTVQQTGKAGSKVVSQSKEVVKTVYGQAPLAKLGVRAGYTMNLGNYNSARIEVSLFVPAAMDRLDEEYEMAKAWVDEKMSSVIEEMKEQA